MVTDAHTHSWGPPSNNHPWINGRLLTDRMSHFSVPIVYDIQRYLEDMASIDIDDAVIVGYPIFEWTDNHYTIFAAAHENLWGIGMVDLFEEDASRHLRQLLNNPGMIGFRLGAMCPYDQMWQKFDSEVSWLERATKLEDIWNTAEDLNSLVQIHVHTSQLEQVQQLVEKYPDLRIVLDHFCNGNADIIPEDTFSELEPLSSYQRVAVKISGIPGFSNEIFPYRDAHPHVRWLLDKFGRDRVLWGSDYPNVSHPDYGSTTYEETLNWVEYVEGISQVDRRWITERACKEFFPI